MAATADPDPPARPDRRGERRAGRSPLLRRSLAARAALLRLPQAEPPRTGRSEPEYRGLPWPSSLVVLLLQQIGSTFAAGQRPGEAGAVDLWARLLLAAGPLLLLVRHRRPRAVAWGSALVTTVYLAAGYPYGPVFLSLAVACVAAAAAGERYAAWGAMGAFWLAHLVAAHWLRAWLPEPGGAHATWTTDLFFAAWVLALGALGELLRVRRTELERRRDEAAEAERHRADEERLRIARELHDVLAHSISVINVQAGMGLALLDSDPQQARTALTTIRTASKEALGEVRQVLETLRAPGEAPRTPAPGLARLADLVEQARSAGLSVATETEGRRRDLPSQTDLAAFRIVQEALTNTVRHSAARTATLRLAYREEEFEVTVDDPGPAAERGPRGSGGNGLVGMRERATALGGALEAGPRADGGFRVRARLPLAAGSVDGAAGERRPREEEP